MARELDIITTCDRYGELCQRIISRIGSHRTPVRHLRFANWEAIDWAKLAKHRTHDFLMISPVADVPRCASRPTNSDPIRRYLLIPEDEPVQSISSRVQQLRIRHESRLHVAGVKDPEDIEALIYRAISGFAESQRVRIIDAWWEGDEFLVLLPSFQRLIVPVLELSRFLGSDTIRDQPFEIDRDGSFVYWPHADVHFGAEQLLLMVAPKEALLAAQKEQNDFNRRYGAVVRKVREQHRLRQSDISGLTPRQIGRIEKGECRATHSAIGKLANAHRLSVSNYLAALAQQLS